jgi:hypothetical protein
VLIGSVFGRSDFSTRVNEIIGLPLNWRDETSTDMFISRMRKNFANTDSFRLGPVKDAPPKLRMQTEFVGRMVLASRKAINNKLTITPNCGPDFDPK